MNRHVNREAINDRAKLVMHRLIARALARDPSLVEKTRASLEKMADRYPDHDFVGDWEQLLSLPVGRIRALLTSRKQNLHSRVDGKKRWTSVRAPVIVGLYLRLVSSEQA